MVFVVNVGPWALLIPVLGAIGIGIYLWLENH